MGKFKSANNQWLTIRFLIIISMGAFGVMGGAIVAPGLPSLLEPFEVSEDVVGLVLGVYTFAAAITLPLTGLLMDLLGRKVVGVSCLLLDGFFGLLCAFAPSFGVLLVFRFFQGIGIAGLIPVAMTIISDWYSGAARLKAIGILSALISVSAVVLPLLGGLLAFRSWQYPFLVYGFSLLVAFFFISFVEETKPQDDQDTKLKLREYFNSFKQTIKIKEIWEVFIHSLVLYFLVYAIATFIPIFMVTVHGLSELLGGLALAVQGFFAAIFAAQADKVNRYFNWRQKTSLGFLLIALAIFLIPYWGSGYRVLISLTLFGVGMGVAQPAIYNRATVVPPEELTGSVVAIFNTMKFIGMTLAPVTLRFIYNLYSFKAVFWLSAAITLLWLIVFSFYFARD
ncbi:MFS transporter [Fuchsiella alkaliacetigena]|uniref:MFS transporter n=1 Tax=Fuchsiella alkaliacetigena TaxID=957042 RepID=UPI00200B52B9|nr:MFS transporter [Fuchsiella alkaliacetigena]MCK8824652.1 MFS transporter [Fuchsiella alkaliacetigena]